MSEKVFEQIAEGLREAIEMTTGQRPLSGGIPDDVKESLKYLENGGLGEVIGFTETAWALRQPKVQSDTDMMMALLILAQRGLAPSTTTTGDRE